MGKDTLEGVNKKLISLRINRQNVANSQMFGFSNRTTGKVTEIFFSMSSDPDSPEQVCRQAMLDKMDKEIMELDAKFKELANHSMQIETQTT